MSNEYIRLIYRSDTEEIVNNALTVEWIVDKRLYRSRWMMLNQIDIGQDWKAKQWTIVDIETASDYTIRVWMFHSCDETEQLIKHLFIYTRKNKNLSPSCFCGACTIHMEYIACNCSRSIIDIQKILQ